MKCKQNNTVVYVRSFRWLARFVWGNVIVLSCIQFHTLQFFSSSVQYPAMGVALYQWGVMAQSQFECLATKKLLSAVKHCQFKPCYCCLCCILQLACQKWLLRYSYVVWFIV